MMARTSGGRTATWFSGWGTTRGADSIRERRLDVEERGVPKPFKRVSWRRVSCGAAAAAAATGSSAGSPSKKRAIAIYLLSVEVSEESASTRAHLHVPLAAAQQGHRILEVLVSDGRVLLERKLLLVGELRNVDLGVGH